MAASTPNRVTFAASTDVPKKIVPIDKMQMSVLNISTTPSAQNAGKDDSKAQLVFTPDDAAQPLNPASQIVVNFGTITTGAAARDAAYAAVIAAGTIL